MEERNEVTQRILNITLDILYLLTGEDYIIVKKPGGRTPNNRLPLVEGLCRKPSRGSVASERHDEKILDLTRKMIGLLTGEVPIRCQDVSVYFSMEEWEYVEGHKDLYEDMMEDRPPLTSPDGSGEISASTVMSDAEESMVTSGDPGPADVPSEDMDLYTGSLHCMDSCEGLEIRIKEEPLSSEEDNLADDHCSLQPPYSSVEVKEEPNAFEEIDVPYSEEQTPETFHHIKEEPLEDDEDSRSTPNIYTPTDHGPATPTNIKEESGTFINVLDMARHADHTRERHSNTVPETLSYQVEIPADKLPDNASLYSVRQKEDSMEILYHCPSCYKGFSSNLDLARHQVIHTVDKLFICSLCGKSFTEMSFLVKHQVIHTDLKLCVCPVCGGCFYSETSLAKHQKTHSLPSFCSTCGKCFFNKTELALHERKHSGERPFGCHVCGKHFIAKSVLNKHLLIHMPMDLKK